MKNGKLSITEAGKKLDSLSPFVSDDEYNAIKADHRKVEDIMKTKSIRIPQDMMSAVELVEKEEKIEESTAMRKLMRIGFETYIANLYKQGKVTLGEAARLLNVNQIEAINLFLDAGIKGNLDTSDVMISLERFVSV